MARVGRGLLSRWRPKHYARVFCTPSGGMVGLYTVKKGWNGNRTLNRRLGPGNNSGFRHLMDTAVVVSGAAATNGLTIDPVQLAPHGFSRPPVGGR